MLNQYFSNTNPAEKNIDNTNQYFPKYTVSCVDHKN